MSPLFLILQQTGHQYFAIDTLAIQVYNQKIYSSQENIQVGE